MDSCGYNCEKGVMLLVAQTGMKMIPPDAELQAKGLCSKRR
jgi:hypothetical protein